MQRTHKIFMLLLSKRENRSYMVKYPTLVVEMKMNEIKNTTSRLRY